ncbi:hypothetical protein NLI96_g2538 [Meripilus lineatus]|uniref:DUF6589 domain-containing protein n=1 Tax=Meripilus lineatus TaxID=2056292 RepID=A0AAD5YLT5_9APHY|nr:hypothetical protein NLI96_g2538 [Physisporinus lineatus]
MAADIRKYLKANPHLHNLWVVFDNIQQYAIRRDCRIGTANEMLVGTGATAIVMEDCPPDAFDAEPYFENLQKGERRDMTAKVIEADLDWEHMGRVCEFHFLDILIQYVPTLAMYRTEVTELFKDLLKKHPINPTRKTTIYPLGTNDANEVSLKGMKEALADIIDQTGITEDALKTKLHFMSGDGKSFQTMGDLKKIISDQRSKDKTLIGVVEILELWHTKWTELCRILSNQFGSKDIRKDPSSLRFVGQVIGIPPPASFTNADFYKSSQLLNIALRAHVLRFWEVRLGTTDIVAYFEHLASIERLPTLDDLRRVAQYLAEQYSTSRAYDDALRNGGPMNMAEPDNLEDADDDGSVISEVEEKIDDRDMLTGNINEQSVPQHGSEEVITEVDNNSSEPLAETTTNTQADKKQQNGESDPEKFEGDWALANSILLVRDGIWWLEFCRAVSIGDTGRVWEVLKFWIFQFAGGSNPNYTNYLLEMFCKIKYELPTATKEALFQNWLVNLSGNEDGFIELDFMQERFNLLLEEFSKHKGQEFSNPWYRLVIAMHVHRFLRLKEEMEDMVDLVPRRKAHSEPHLDNEFNEVLRLFREWGIHTFKAGRDLGHHAQDQFARGMAQLAKEKVKKFVDRSMQGRVDLEIIREMNDSFPDPPVHLHHPRTVQYDNTGRPRFSDTLP